MWAFASLLPHDRRSECRADFFSKIDVMYVSTEDAQKSLTESERQQIIVAAEAVEQHLTKLVLEIVSESSRQLKVLDENDLRRVVAEAIHDVRLGFLKVADLSDVLDLMARCIVMCGAVDCYSEGYEGADSERQTQIVAVFECCMRIREKTLDAVKSGRLLIHNGKIVRPHEDGFEESGETNEPTAEVGTVKSPSDTDEHTNANRPTAMDLTELFDVSLPGSFEFFESELQKLGLPLSAATQPGVSDQIAENWIVHQRMNRMKALCRQLQIIVTEEQVRNIAKNSLVTHDSFSRGVPLSSDERAIAIEIHYQAQKASLQKDGVFLSEDDQRSEARRTIAFGEKGITTLHKIGKLFFGK
jgi:hypothetical protein